MVFSVVSSPQIQPLQVLEVLAGAVEEAQQAGGIFPLFIREQRDNNKTFGLDRWGSAVS